MPQTSNDWGLQQIPASLNTLQAVGREFVESPQGQLRFRQQNSIIYKVAPDIVAP